MNLKQLSRALLATALAGLGMSAQAYDSWTYGAGGGTDTASAGAATLTTTGYYAANTTTTANSVVTYTGITGNWTSGTLVAYPGLGMSSDNPTGSPNHALDSAGTNTEAVLLQFSSSTILTGLDLSFISGDADVSVFRYTGTSDPTALTSTGATLAAMTAAGWQLVGNYANLTQDDTSPYKYNLINGATDKKETPTDDTSTVVPTASSTSVGSSWWLVVAYNVNYGSGTGLEQGNDYFKLLSVAGEACTTAGTKCATTTTGKAPEPASLALAAVGLIGVASTRRKKKSA